MLKVSFHDTLRIRFRAEAETRRAGASRRAFGLFCKQRTKPHDVFRAQPHGWIAETARTKKVCALGVAADGVQRLAQRTHGLQLSVRAHPPVGLVSGVERVLVGQGLNSIRFRDDSPRSSLPVR